MPSLRFPRSILELGRVFADEKTCLRYLSRIRWPHGFTCPYCGGRKGYPISERAAVKCASCERHVYLKVGTVMEKSKTSLCSWFAGAYLMTTLTPGISAVQFQRQVNIPSYECAFQILHKLRAAAGQRELPRLTGEVEVDETYVGAVRKGKRGRGAKGKALVVAAVEVRGHAAGRARLRKISHASKRELGRFLKDHVELGTKVNTDGWKGYRGIEKLGYEHDVVIESTDESDVKDWLSHVHRVFGNLKTWLNGTHHGVSPKHMQAYLNEYVFRFNRRRKPKQAFDTLLGLAVQRGGPTYEKLYHAGFRGGWKHPNPLGFEVAML